MKVRMNENPFWINLQYRNYYCTVRIKLFWLLLSSIICECYFWILLWMSTLLIALNNSVNITCPEILRWPSLKWETEINWSGHEIFLEKVTGTWNFYLFGPLGYKIFFGKTLRLPSPPPAYLYNVHSLKKDFSYYSFLQFIIKTITSNLQY